MYITINYVVWLNAVESSYRLSNHGVAVFAIAAAIVVVIVAVAVGGSGVLAGCEHLSGVGVWYSLGFNILITKWLPVCLYNKTIRSRRTSNNRA